MILIFTVLLFFIVLVMLFGSTTNRREGFGGCNTNRCLPLEAKLDAWCGTKFEEPYLTKEERALCAERK